MKLIIKKCVTSIPACLLSITLMSTVLLSGPVSAAEPSQCKGLENNACASANSCSWVESYERKDGRKVSAFCRTKAKSKSTSAVTSKINNKAS